MIKLQEGCTVQPQTKEELAAIIKQTCEEQGWDCDLNFIDTSKITDMSMLFCLDYVGDEELGYGLNKFNGDISRWDTSNVTDMSCMFSFAESFNQPLDNWDTSNVKSMLDMFSYAKSFNQPLDNWDTSNVKYMESMFWGAKSFNQPLDNWNVSNVENMRGMFWGAESFNQPLNNWDTSNVEDMKCMFGYSYADSFKSELPDFKKFKGSKEKLLDDLGLPPDFKPVKKKNQEQKQTHKKCMSRLILTWQQITKKGNIND